MHLLNFVAGEKVQVMTARAAGCQAGSRSVIRRAGGEKPSGSRF
jgi:hypothetical protein